MDELIKALTRLANAAAVYYERAGNPMVSAQMESPMPGGEAPAKRAYKKREAKAIPSVEGGAAAAVPALAASAGEDPLNPTVEASKPAAPAPKQEEVKKYITEAESKSMADAAAQAYVNKFPTMEEGLKAARKILADEPFKVGRLADLTHPMRLAFAAKLKELMPA